MFEPPHANAHACAGTRLNTTSSATAGIDENARLAELNNRAEKPEDKWQPTRLFRTC